MEKEKLNKEIENILQSGKKSEVIKTSPFFTTRVMGRIENQKASNNIFTAFQLNSIVKPALIVLLIVNVINLYFFRGNTSVSVSDSQVTISEHEYLAATNDFVYTEELLTQK